MIKGGFQGLDISGVDLTAQSPSLPGGYATCQAAVGKTVLVLTAAGAVQCSVKKVSTNYVLAGITGDGKILSITVGSTDGISVSETEIPSGEEPVVSLDTADDISTATSSSPYITEFDGIARVRKINPGALSADVSVFYKSKTAGNGVLLFMPKDSGAGTAMSCFVKKGTQLYAENVVSTVTALFFPYKPVQS